jgi:hypothetical protein
LPDGEITYSVDLLTRDEEPDLKKAQKKIQKRFWNALDQVTEGIVNLALRAEKEDVRLRASNRILDEFSDRGRMLEKTKVQVQILNAIPMDRAAIVEGKEVPTVEWEGTQIALPKKIREIHPAPQEPIRGANFRGGGSIKSGEERSVGFTADPVSVDVPSLPKRDNKGK